MGYNKEDKDLVLRHIDGVGSVLDMGSANDYTTHKSLPPFISEWYKSMGILDYTCIDLAGDNNSIIVDVSSIVDIGKQVDLLVNTGFSEHVCQMNGYVSVPFHGGYINSIYPKEVTNAELGFYYCWYNMFHFVKSGGVMVHVNPKSGHWPGHAYHYIDESFYKKLERISDLSIIELYEHPACNNFETGMNICCVLKKIGNKFPSIDEFSKLPIYKS